MVLSQIQCYAKKAPRNGPDAYAPGPFLGASLHDIESDIARNINDDRDDDRN